MTVAFLYNVRHKYPDPKDNRTQLEADFDDPKTIEWIITHLKNSGYEVLPIEANEEAYFKLQQNKAKIDLAFNYAEGIYGADREAQIPAILEMLSIPYTGSTPLVQAIGLDKGKTKEILIANNIPTMPFQIFKTLQEKLNHGLFFPVIIKPVSQGSSAGITNKSVVFNEEECANQVKYIWETFNQPAMAEPFLTGREFSVSLLGNPPKILPIIESVHAKLPEGYMPLDSLEVKWFFEEETSGANFSCPAVISDELKNKIEKICLDSWSAIGYRDLCRMDLRCNGSEDPYVLEINSPPGMIPPEVSTTSYFPLSAREAGMDYETLLKTILETALKRYEDGH